MMSNSVNTTLYTGVTNDLIRRVYEHKKHLVKGFTSKYNTEKLVYYEFTQSIESAIEREKQIKGYRRDKKDELVNAMNPEWKDLYEKLI